MKRRCYNPAEDSYPYYGGKGITVCDEWLHSFPQFLADVGPKPTPKHSIDRINNDLPYRPDNVRWATSLEQCQNRSVSRYVNYKGERLPLAEHARRAGLPPKVVDRRLRRGWPLHVALTRSLDRKKHQSPPNAA